MFKTFKATAVFSAIALLVACGGGGNSADTSAAPQVATGSQVGVLTDAQIEGVRYVTSSGVTGTTDAAGRYNYNPGDTVTFSIGAVSLGEVPATGIVTPVQLAVGSDTKLVNLLVLLQSLDRDGDPSNGLTISSTSAAALTSSIDLGAALSASATAAIQTAMTAGGVQGEVKTVAEAKDHFISQAQALFASNVWIAKDENGKPIASLYSTSDGSYLLGDASSAENGGMPGPEYGTFSVTDVDSSGFAIQSSTTRDLNGEFGLSHSQPEERFIVDGETLKVIDSLETAVLVKMDNDPTGIVGAWAFASSTSATTPTKDGLFMFFSNGYFLFTDTYGESRAVPLPSDICGEGGMELGKYAYDTATKVVTPTGKEVNTNGCVGLFETDGETNPTTHTFTISADGKTAVWTGDDNGTDGPWQVNLVRVSK